MRPDRFPLTYDECRDRFRWACRHAGLSWTAHPIAALGPHGQQLTIDVTSYGAIRPGRALVILTGVHGDEGFSSSALLCDAIERWVVAGSDPQLADDVAVLMVHAVNPWGMSQWRRQNESNVDLNRNWGRDERIDVPQNDGYDLIHHVLVPGGDQPPTPASLLDVTRALIEEHGYSWVKSAVSEGQYDHPDGLYFGGDRTEESNLILAQVVADRLAGADDVLVVDLHTGHGEFGTYSLLSHVSEDHPDDAWLRSVFDADRIECTSSATATTGPKHGQIAMGLNDVVAATTWRAVTMELGTISDTRMIINERAEHWVHFHGDRSTGEHAQIIWDHRCGSTPDDAGWETSARAHGVDVLDAARRAMCSTTRAEEQTVGVGNADEYVAVTFDRCDHVEGPFFHGTKLAFEAGDELVPGHGSNYHDGRTSNNVYFSALVETAIWGAELATALAGSDQRGHVYVVEPAGPFEDDPNVTNKRFPGNVTKSYRTRHPLRIVGEVATWEGHAPELLDAMLDNIAQLRAQGLDVIED